MNDDVGHGAAFSTTPPPEWALRHRKSATQHTWDLLGAPLRMVLLPDQLSERLHLTSLRAERFRAVLPELSGRVLDMGCGDNMLLRLYESSASHPRLDNVGADVIRWSEDVHLIPNSSELDFAGESFDTVCFVACLNHIPERLEALREAYRVLRPGGRLVVTMIGRLVGVIGHALWWYSEDKERDMHPDEEMGLDARDVIEMLRASGFSLLRHQRFGYGLNHLFVAEK